MYRLLLALASVCCLPLLSQVPRFPTAINTSTDAFAYDFSITAPVGASATFVWNSYGNGTEHILARSVVNGIRFPINELSPGGGLYYHPIVVTTSPRSGRVFWMDSNGSTWHI